MLLAFKIWLGILLVLFTINLIVGPRVGSLFPPKKAKDLKIVKAYPVLIEKKAA